MIGLVFAAPWGRYVLHREGPPRVLRSLDRGHAYIVDPDARYVATGELVGSDPVPRQTDPVNGSQRGGVGRHHRNESSPQHDQVPGTSPRRASSGGNLLVDSVAVSEETTAVPAREGGPRVVADAHAAVVSDGPWRPGLNAPRGFGLPQWMPCLSRARDENGHPLAREHCWFLDVPGTLYCHECRVGRARVVYGPAGRIAEVREAIGRGDRDQVDELVRRLHDPAPAVAAQPVDDPVENDPPDSPAYTSPEHTPVADLAERLGVTGETGALLVRTRGDVLDADSVDFVYEPCWRGTTLADWKEFAAERAAIFEYLAGVPRAVAEAKARQLAGPPPTRRAA